MLLALGAAAGAAGGKAGARGLLSDPVPGTASGAAYEASVESAKGATSGLPERSASLQRGSFSTQQGRSRRGSKDLDFSWEKADHVVSTNAPLFVPDRTTESETLIAAVTMDPEGAIFVPAA